jgi:hypothetical protein
LSSSIVDVPNNPQNLQEEELKDTILLVFANKQDMRGAYSAAQVSEALDLASIRGRQWIIQETSAAKGKGLFEGFDWYVGLHLGDCFTNALSSQACDVYSSEAGNCIISQLRLNKRQVDPVVHWLLYWCFLRVVVLLFILSYGTVQGYLHHHPTVLCTLYLVGASLFPVGHTPAFPPYGTV